MYYAGIQGARELSLKLSLLPGIADASPARVCSCLLLRNTLYSRRNTKLVREGCRLIEIWLYESCGYKKVRLIERRLNMLLMSTLHWVIIGVAVVVVAVIIGTKIKDKYN